MCKEHETTYRNILTEGKLQILDVPPEHRDCDNFIYAIRYARHLFEGWAELKRIEQVLLEDIERTNDEKLKTLHAEYFLADFNGGKFVWQRERGHEWDYRYKMRNGARRKKQRLHDSLAWLANEYQEMFSIISVVPFSGDYIVFIVDDVRPHTEARVLNYRIIGMSAEQRIPMFIAYVSHDTQKYALEMLDFFSREQRKGIGSMGMTAIKKFARSRNCVKVWAVKESFPAS